MTEPHPTRTTVVWCPDWPVVATGVSPLVPAVVLRANRVVAASPAARAEGVVRGQRRRESQARCPQVVVTEQDPLLEARAFEPVVAAVERITPLIEIIRPGVCAFATRGPSRYHGGDIATMAAVEQAVAEVLDGRGVVGVGTADGSFAAGLAARRPHQLERLVPPGGSPEFLAPFPVATLDRPDLVDVLERLGLTTLGRFAALPRADVVARFGVEGRAAHRLASGLDEHPPDARPVPPSFEVATEVDPPAERVDQVAFVGKALADQLHERLDAMGLACSLLAIRADTDHGEQLLRRWRHDGALSPGAIADRVRWQLDGWLTGSADHPDRPTAGISRLVLTPEEVRPATGRQLGFWGGRSPEGERAERALARVQAILGPGSVLVPERRGGRDPADRIRLVPVEAVNLSEPRILVEPPEPWPGQVPAPSPTTAYTDPPSAEVLDADGHRVGVDGRGTITAPPHELRLNGGSQTIVAWAGPWPIDERWWDPTTHRRRARIQVVTTDGAAHMLVLEGRRWWLSATYD